MSLQRIVIGGGGIVTTTSLPIFKTALDVTGVTGKPNVLVISTPKNKEGAYDKSNAGLTGLATTLGLQMRQLHRFGEVPSLARTLDLLDWADMFYMTGGDTRYMLEQLGPLLMDAIRRSAIKGQTVACGISAGCAAWFLGCHSDFVSYEVAEDVPWHYVQLEVGGPFRSIVCPHFDTEHPQTEYPRASDFEEMMWKQSIGTVGIGLPNNTGLQIIGGEVTMLSTNTKAAQATRLVVTEHGGLSRDVLTSRNGVLPLAEFVR